ncbi:MAG: hypothetical protein ACK5N8_05540 [Alphaproteobacteria bacterium]
MKNIKSILLFLCVAFAFCSCKSTQNPEKSVDTLSATTVSSSGEYTVEDFKKMDNVLDVDFRGNDLFAVNKYSEGWQLYNKKGQVVLPAGYYSNNFCDLVKIKGGIYIRVNTFNKEANTTTYLYFQDGKEIKEVGGKAIDKMNEDEIVFFDRISDREEDLDCDTEDVYL